MELALPIIVQAVAEIVESSDDDDDEDLLIMAVATQFRCNEGRQQRIHNYLESVVYLYSDSQFKSHFRMTRQTFFALLRLLNKYLIKNISRKNEFNAGRDTIAPEKQLLLALWIFGTPESYRYVMFVVAKNKRYCLLRSVSDRFDVGRATAIRSVRRVTKALNHVQKQFIKWPKLDEIPELHRAFQVSAGFPNVIGVVDGTHVKIRAPKNHPEAYINRKNFHSIQLQVVCDHTRKFLHCYVGQPGSVHDQRVFRLSSLQDICNNHHMFPENSHLIGDAAYMNQEHLLVPYRDNGRLTIQQRNYNYCLSSTRMVVERSLALLKGRFRSLLDCLSMTRTDLIPQYIMACCVLHNICLLHNDLFDVPLIIEDNAINRRDNGHPHFQQQGTVKRNIITANLEIRR